MVLADPEIPSSKIFDLIADGLNKMTDAEKKDQMKKVNGIFEMRVKNPAGKEATYTIDVKKEGKVIAGPATKPSKPDVTISLSDDTFQQLADGKLNGQKAFMSGKLKVKGNIMLATKLDVLLKVCRVLPTSRSQMRAAVNAQSKL